jgi:hypothetical protein
MPVNYSCFISYTSGWTPEYDRLIDAVETRLKEKLQYHLDIKPWRYSTAEAIGAQFQEVIPARLCESVCMVVLYVPKYELSEICIREFAAMEDIEAARLKVLNPPAGTEYPMIVPIILRKRAKDKVPDWIKNSRNYLDLTEYITPDQELLEALDHPKCKKRFAEIAENMGEVYIALVNHNPDPCQNCNPKLPPTEDVRVQERWIRQRSTLTSRQTTR